MGISSLVFKTFLYFFSLVVVAFGQPIWSLPLALFVACLGYALLWVALDDVKTFRYRFYLSAVWFALIQMVQLSWALSHPYIYIYFVWFSVSCIFGCQFGLLTGWIQEERVKKFSWLIFYACLWVLLEWSRPYLFEGLTWNAAGLTLSASQIPLQLASLGGIFFLSLVVMLTNLCAYRLFVLWRHQEKLALPAVQFFAIALFPYLFGGLHLAYHLPKLQEAKEKVGVLLVQPAFSVHALMQLNDPAQALADTYRKWQKILRLVAEKKETKPDLIVLPEHVVSYGTYYPVFPLESVQRDFVRVFGKGVLDSLPGKQEHLTAPLELDDGSFWMANNAYWTQSLANVFDAEVVAGLEDTEEFYDKPKETYISAMVFFPKGETIERYEKRVLLPLGEYVPFDCLKDMARSYGIMGSFTPGKQAKVISGKSLSYGLSICIEETYGHLMRDNRVIGAEMLVNLTNDFWYPNSLLPRQHFDHAKLRAVEMGIPLVRAANTGVTGAYDSLGQVIATLGQEEENPEAYAGALYVEVPRYHYTTVYTYTGDLYLIALCFLVVCSFLVVKRPGFK